MELNSVFGADSDSIEDLRHKVKEGVSRLKGVEVGDELGIEILAQLIEGKKTVSEIVERVYGVTSSDEGFASSYGRAWREIKRLESKGLVSRKLFGNEKPYRLTQLAVTNLARIGGEEQQLPLVTNTDLLAYAITLALATPFILRAIGWLQLAESLAIGLFPCFCFFLGISFVEVSRTFRRVF